jgi:hypothetical protein
MGNKRKTSAIRKRSSRIREKLPPEFKSFEDFARKVVAVPKSEVDEQRRKSQA